MAETGETLRKIQTLAAVMRSAFDAADKSKLMINLRAFPRGACGDASLLLAHLLEEGKCGKFDYMVGDRERGGTHAWLQRDELVIDITADQFNEGLPPVFVSFGSKWHALQNGEREYDAKLSVFGPDWERTLLWNYRYLRTFIPDNALAEL